MKTLSYSNYSLLRQCGQRYKLEILDKVPRASVPALEFGSALHAGLHDALVTQDVESALDVFRTYWKTVPAMDFTGERFTADMLSDLGERFVSNFTRRYANKMRLITGEQRMYAELPGENITLEGTPDALVEWEGRRVLLDFKSSAYAYVLNEKQASSLQLNLYAWLLTKNAHAVDAIAYVPFVKTSGSIQTLAPLEFNEKKALEMIVDMVRYFKRENAYAEKNANSCLMGKQVCPHFSRCWS